MSPTIEDLLGENLSFDDGLGEDRSGPDLVAGWEPERVIDYVPMVSVGDPLTGPDNEQPLVVYRDNRVIAADELGAQGPFIITPVARLRAGRTFPLNYLWGAGLDNGMVERVPEQDARTPSIFGPQQSAYGHDGVMPPEVLPDTYTVPYTFTSDVGYGQD